MGLFTFTSEISISDLMIGGGVLVAMLKIFLTDRDLKRDLVKAVGDLCQDVEVLQKRQEAHHEWLIGAGLDRRQQPNRRATP